MPLTFPGTLMRLTTSKNLTYFKYKCCTTSDLFAPAKELPHQMTIPSLKCSCFKGTHSFNTCYNPQWIVPALKSTYGQQFISHTLHTLLNSRHLRNLSLKKLPSRELIQFFIFFFLILL